MTISNKCNNIHCDSNSSTHTGLVCNKNTIAYNFCLNRQIDLPNVNNKKCTNSLCGYNSCGSTCLTVDSEFKMCERRQIVMKDTDDIITPDVSTPTAIREQSVAITVLQIVERYNNLKTEVKDMEHALGRLRNISDWEDGIDKDDRKSVQLLYGAYKDARTRLETFEHIKFIGPNLIQ